MVTTGMADDIKKIESLVNEDVDIVFFDMDHTVISIDCDVSWKYFLAGEGLAPDSDRAEADRFLEIYHQGLTNVEQFLAFQLREFAGRTTRDMRDLARRHFESRVRDKVYVQAAEVIAGHLQQGMRVALLTGTNRIIAEPIAEHLQVTDLLATELEVHDERFTGKVIEPYLMKEGKVKMAESYCRNHHSSLQRCAFYADSITDLNLLEKVSRPAIVNPRNRQLSELARSRQWPVLQWNLAD
jgi:HAD superfamily hydrolase (TIGR01490 family)